MTTSSTTTASNTRPNLDRLSDEERYRRFGEELDALKHRTLERVGDADVAYIRRLDRFSRAMEIVGRALIHVSLDPFSFLTGVGALWVHKQLQTAEIGHTALHGTYDRLPGAEKFGSKTIRWDAPIDEEAWRYAHNVCHHGGTNIAGKDPDIHLGLIRLTRQTPWSPRQRLQLAMVIGFVFPNFVFLIASHACGRNDVFFDNGRPDKTDILPDRSRKSASTPRH